MLKDLSCNACDRCDGDGDGSDGHSYRIEAVMHVIDVMAIVLDIVIGLKQCAGDRRDADAHGHCYRFEGGMAMVMDIVKGLKL